MTRYRQNGVNFPMFYERFLTSFGMTVYVVFGERGVSPTMKCYCFCGSIRRNASLPPKNKFIVIPTETKCSEESQHKIKKWNVEIYPICSIISGLNPKGEEKSVVSL